MNPKLLLTVSAGVIFALSATLTINQKPAAKEKPPVPKKVDHNEVELEEYRPLDQAFLNELKAKSGSLVAFKTAFEAGDELTEFSFTAQNGVGANVGEGRRFTRFPRADLNADEEWTTHLPKREGGPNATSCIACHNAPIANGAGDVALNVVVDPAHSGDPSKYLERNTLPLFALGVPQRLAEEMSIELSAARTAILRNACTDGTASGRLKAKGVSFGKLSAKRLTKSPCEVRIDSSGLDGIDEDLVVKAFGWKGNQPTIRAFTRNAAHNELGMQGVELSGDEDGDRDGVKSELSVGDMTALTIYMAALERPVTKLELASLGLLKVSENQRKTILQGEEIFKSVGCATCHVPEMQLENAVFSEPGNTPGFFDKVFPSGAEPSAHDLTQKTAIVFDLTEDQPNNRIEVPGKKDVRLGSLKKNAAGGAIANWFTDFKRHDMGKGLADPSDPLGLGANMWLTRSLAGVGSTGPWLHDGRATTLDEAIRTHGGDAQESAKVYADLSGKEREALVAFLENLVIFKKEEKNE